MSNLVSHVCTCMCVYFHLPPASLEDGNVLVSAITAARERRVADTSHEAATATRTTTGNAAGSGTATGKGIATARGTVTARGSTGTARLPVKVRMLWFSRLPAPPVLSFAVPLLLSFLPSFSR